MHQDVVDYVKTCELCNKRKVLGEYVNAPMKSIRCTAPWDMVAVDCCSFPQSRNDNVEMVVFQDYFTKWLVAIPVPDIKAKTIASVFIKHIVTKFGVPRILLSNQGRNFTSNLPAEICKLLQLEKVFTTPYHPQCDGMVERANRTIQNALAPYVHKDQRSWDDMLDYVCFAYKLAHIIIRARVHT